MPRINPLPVIFLGGPNGGMINTTGDGDTNAAIDDLTLTWGRQAEDEDVKASTCSVRVWVPAGDLRFLQGSLVIGQDLILSWVHETTQFVIFQGRVTSYQISVGPSPRVPSALSRGFIVTINGSDRIADLVNVLFGPNTLSNNDTMIVRANLIKNSALDGGVALNGVFFEPQTTGWRCNSYDTQGTNLRQWVDAFYMSLGNWWTFCHDDATIRGVRRWANPAPRRWTAYNGGQRNGRPLVTIKAADVTYDNITYPSTFMPGRECYFEGDETLDSGTQGSMINNIVAEYKDHTNVDRSLNKPNPGKVRKRTFSYKSWLDNDTQIGQVNGDLNTLFQYNMFPPKLPPITWDTSLGGGFLSLGQARALTRAYENPGEIVIGGSHLTAILSANNQVQACGGIVRYIKDHWEITINPKWCGSFSKTTPIKGSNMPNVPANQLDPGLTGYDLYDVPTNTIYQGEA